MVKVGGRPEQTIACTNGVCLIIISIFVFFKIRSYALILFVLFSAIRSTSWRGGESDGGTSFNSDLTSPSPGRLERSKSSNSGLGLTSRDHDILSTATNLNRRFGAGSNNTSWDDDNLPEW